MMKLKLIFLVLAALVVSACGSTSNIKPVEQYSEDLNVSSYDEIVVLDFEDGTKKSDMPRYAGRIYADKIAAAIQSQGLHPVVHREPIKKHALVIGGQITRYVEGSPTLKFLIGMGAGSTYFDANVELRDNTSGALLGKIDVDRNSWGLGGMVAATQSVDLFMQESAKHIAKDLAKGRANDASSPEQSEETAPASEQPD